MITVGNMSNRGTQKEVNDILHFWANPFIILTLAIVFTLIGFGLGRLYSRLKIVAKLDKEGYLKELEEKYEKKELAIKKKSAAELRDAKKYRSLEVEKIQSCVDRLLEERV